MPTGRRGGGGGVVGMKKLKTEEPRVNIMERERVKERKTEGERGESKVEHLL